MRETVQAPSSDARIIVRAFDNTRWHSNGVAYDIVCQNRQEAERTRDRIAAGLKPGQSVLVLSREASATFLARGQCTSGNNRAVHVIRDVDLTADMFITYCGLRIPRQARPGRARLPRCARCSQHHSDWRRSDTGRQ